MVSVCHPVAKTRVNRRAGNAGQFVLAAIIVVLIALALTLIIFRSMRQKTAPFPPDKRSVEVNG